MIRERRLTHLLGRVLQGNHGIGGQRLRFVDFIHNLAQLLCHFCPLCRSLSRIGQTVEQPNWSKQNLVYEHQGHAVQVKFVPSVFTLLHALWLIFKFSLLFQAPLISLPHLRRRRSPSRRRHLLRGGGVASDRLPKMIQGCDSDSDFQSLVAHPSLYNVKVKTKGDLRIKLTC